VDVIAPVGDRVATNISFVQVCAHVYLMPGPGCDAQAMTFNLSATGLITKPSKYSVPDTIKRFSTAVQAKGYIIFTEIDHAAAA
jgi:hypothetical protein